MSFTGIARLTLIVAPTAAPAMIPHPTFTASDIAQMPASERVYFLDSPESHIVAFQDAQRAMMIEARNEETMRMLRVRARDQRQGSRVWESDRYQANARQRAHDARG